MRSNTMPFPWKVGVLAKEAGLTVRTLHHYDEMGLLRPSARSEAGHRLYTGRDLAKLQRVLSLRQLGFPLEEIVAMLDKPEFSARKVIELQLERLRDRMELTQKLYDRLRGIARVLDRKQTVSAEALIKTIEVMNMLESYYTKEQLEQLKARGERIGTERIREAEGEWRDLLEKVNKAMADGKDPTDEPVKVLARKWLTLIREFTGGDAGIAQSLGKMNRENPGMHDQYGMNLNREVFAFIGKAIEAVKTEEAASNA